VTAAALLLEKRVERVGQHIVRAELFLDLWFYFEEDSSRQTIIETMRDYNEFFRFTPHAYLTTYVVYMAGVFETRKDTINLVTLVREVKSTGRLSSLDEATLDALMTTAKAVAKKVAVLRNLAFAHRTASMSYDDAFRLANVKPLELREVTDIALQVANRLLRLCGLQEQHFTKEPRNAAIEMMRALTGR
jgi:hypothetical protein